MTTTTAEHVVRKMGHAIIKIRFYQGHPHFLCRCGVVLDENEWIDDDEWGW